MELASERIMHSVVEEAKAIVMGIEVTIGEGEIPMHEVSKGPMHLLGHTIATNSDGVATPSMRTIRHMDQGAI